MRAVVEPVATDRSVRPPHGPQRARRDQRPGLRVVSTQVQRLTDAATGKSLEAIRRVRSEIRGRLGEDDAAAWN